MPSSTGIYPALKPFREEQFAVSDLHTLYVAQYGNPNGLAAVHLHGGPGGGTDPYDARRFDPEVYRIVLFDQRGSGKSTPSSELRENTTWDLVEDIEKIRSHLQIEKWIVFGGSWGSTLSLAYAQKHPERVLALVLRGIFCLRKEELKFFYQGDGTSFLFPEYWQEYISVIPENEREDIIKAYHRRLTGDDKSARAAAAKAWTTWEMATSKLHIDEAMVKEGEDPAFADVFARIECHYFVNEGWMRQGQLLEKEEVDKLRKIPAVIVQGRYDCVCPMTTAEALHRVWPEAKYIVVPDAGHSAKEKGIETALMNATDDFRRLKDV
ncbi:uncharacterized protein L969DRAFT_67928 [Mixia osmundae IAM 14324]|uniref:Proline iminopeptidase n=1 Tax=Mixia osmundae (strain CBS 9802 / IAM 14324 / JCM 22182 / KY 12970) TaxID=764103 RepID=G7E4J2_MIXOS|nr:uncharacterized protein L969DRAFT_67928 [Mixia osmundae IAM 14324]KEI36231.1 hypothetical protein L969DRAFT_67928 [Mixia osmundae IAM 14324]GAA97752.1 hypothetical protein E5Q_04431 [Mixia osmundae IAM 14324]